MLSLRRGSLLRFCFEYTYPEFINAEACVGIKINWKFDNSPAKPRNKGLVRYWFRLEQISQVSKSLFFTVLQFFMRYRLLVKFSYFVKDVFRLFCFALHQKPTDWFWRKTVIMHGEKKTLCCYHGVITCAVLAHLPRSWHVDKTQKKRLYDSWASLDGQEPGTVMPGSWLRIGWKCSM